MDNKKLTSNVSNDALQSTLGSSETRHTQVFVLPPELLKGLIPKNKIPEMNITKNVREQSILKKKERSTKFSISTEDSTTGLHNTVNKCLYLENDSSIILNPINEAPFQKKKRGRPPKLFNSINKVLKKSSNKSDCHAEIKDMQINCTQKRKRGRPPKLSDTFIKTFKEHINENNSKCLSQTVINTDIKEYSKNKGNLDNDLVILQNEKRQLKLSLSSVESSKIIINKMIDNSNNDNFNISNYDNSNIANNDNLNIANNENCLENEGIHNEYSQKIILKSNNTQKRKGRGPKSKLNKPSIFNDKKHKEDIHKQNNCQTNSNKKCTINEACLEIKDGLKKRRRGRPSKSKILYPTVSSDKVDNNIINDNTHLELNVNNVNEDDLVNLDVQDNLIPTHPQKRKRSSRFSIINDNSNECNSDSINKQDSRIVTSLELGSCDLKSTNTKSVVDGNGLSGDSYSISDDDENNKSKTKRKYPFNVYKKRKRGRPKGGKRKNNRDDDYIPHHSQLQQSSKKESLKLNSSLESNTKKVFCGKCNMEILKNQWPHHNLSIHNDLGWIKGTTKPDFENDEKFLKRVLFNAIKKRRGNLICEMCSVIKRSVLGFISHTMFCGKDEEEKQALMVTCPVCKAVTKPSSLEYHERLHKIQTEEKQKTNCLEIENTNLGLKIKRKAAEKAVSKISEFTALSKDDTDNTLLSDKKLKLNFNSVKKLIQNPQLIKRIPNTVLGKWKKNLNIGESAICSEIKCEFNSKSLNEIKQHYLMCNFTPQENYVCKICQFQTLSINEIIEHVSQNHSMENNYDTNTSTSDSESFSSDNISEVDDFSEKNVGLTKKFLFKENIKSSNKMFKFLFRDGACHTKYNKPFFAAFQWTLEFEQKNYKFDLFEELVPNNFKLLSIKEAKNYLPTIEQSMLMKSEKTGNQDSVESEWKKWKRFEGGCIQDNPTFFVGGPVWALAWLPIPTSLAFSENISQFIAISTHPTMDAEYSVGETYSGKNIIQIWNFGDLNNETNSTCDPKLAYAIAHEGGTVWCLDWCPSGCYQNNDSPNFINENDQLKRMGLLAAACSDGCVRVYSLIFPENLPSFTDCIKTSENFEDTRNMEQIYPIYNTEPVLILVVNLGMYDKNQQTWQVTKLSWTKENEHNIIVAGFSNGYIALWDLTSKSSMLKCKRGNTIFLNPYKHFLAHHHAVTMVYLIPQDNKRFLATGSLDRYYKFWDLEDITNPRNFLKKSFVTDGSWLNNWCCALIAYDDALSMNHSYSYCLPLREYTYKYYNILPTNSTSYAISTSDFGNSIANGTLAGEVLAMFPQQLLYIRDMDKILPRKRYKSIVSSVEVVDFQVESEDKELNSNKKREKKIDKSEYNYMPSTYNDSKDRFGLKFCDKMNLFQDENSSQYPKNHKKILTCEMMQSVPIEQYPFMSVNRLAWNPNAWSFLWLAVGYQNGFVRLISFKSLASTTEWNKLLISHLDKIKSENAVTKNTVISNDE